MHFCVSMIFMEKVDFGGKLAQGHRKPLKRYGNPLVLQGLAHPGRAGRKKREKLQNS